MKLKLLIAAAIITTAANIVVAVERSRALADAPAPKTPLIQPGTQPMDGDVFIGTREIVDGEDIVQIIDRTRSVICYGKMNVGGAATISCQKFSK